MFPKSVYRRQNRPGSGPAPYIFMIITTEGYLSVQKIMRRPMKHDRHYRWVKSRTSIYTDGKLANYAKKNDEGYFQIFVTFGKMRIFECGFRQYVSNLYGK